MESNIITSKSHIIHTRSLEFYYFNAHIIIAQILLRL